MALLDVEDLSVTFARRGQRTVRRRRSLLLRGRGRGGRPGRRVRLRQVGHLTGDHGSAAQAARSPGGRQGRLRRHRPAPDRRTVAAGHPGSRRRDDLPGSALVAESGRADRSSGDRGADPAPWHAGRGGVEGSGAAAGPGRHPRSETAAEGVSPPALRRHAPARPDRHGGGLPAPAAHRRRADDRPGRHHPGADPGTAEGPGPGLRHRACDDHARPGRGGRHVRHDQRALRRSGGGDRAAATVVPSASAPVHRGAARLGAAPGRGTR